MKKILLAFIIVVVSAPAFCGESSGPISSYLVSRYGKLFFASGPGSNRPACSLSNDWAVDLAGPDAAAGRAMLGVILAAHAAGKTIAVVGKGVCDVSGGRETVEYIVVS